MSTNVLVALRNILDNSNNNLGEMYQAPIKKNKANSMGDVLEYYIKDAFCNSFQISNYTQKQEVYGKYLSYVGNDSNPPDFMIKDGAAIEVKKMEKFSLSDLALNSSYPKDYLYATSNQISKECKNAENWQKKDMIYTVGNIVDSQIRLLWMVYGDCYAEDKSIYENIGNVIKNGISNINGVKLAATKELARVNNVDLLNATYLRVRPMWGIQHPMKFFSYLPEVNAVDKNHNYDIYVLISKVKYDELPQEHKDDLDVYIKDGKLSKHNIKIKNPNDINTKMDVVLYIATL